MAISLNPRNLLSRIIRLNTSQGRTGRQLIETPPNRNRITRTINNLARYSRQDSGNIVSWIFNNGGKFVGWIVDGIGWLGISATKIVDWIVTGTSALASFDWNQSDKDLVASIEAGNQQIASAWGGLIGNGLGSLAGIAVGYGVGLICPVIGGGLLATAVALAVAKDSLPEFVGLLTSAVGQTVGILAKDALIGSYILFRRAVKSLPLNQLEGFFGKDIGKFIKNQWGNEDGPSWTMGEKLIEEPIEKISDKNLRAFTESLLDEAFDRFIETGYIIAQEIDEAYLQQRYERTTAQGPERTIQVIPDARTDDPANTPQEVINIVGVPQEEARTLIQQSLINHRLVHNRDIGLIIGEQAVDAVARLTQERQLKITFRGKAKPPWIGANGKAVRINECTIKKAKRGLTWKEIKLAARQYTFGKFKAKALLEDGQTMELWGATSEEASKKLKELLKLSELKLISMDVVEEVERDPRTKKSPELVYPAYCTLLIKKISTSGTGRTDINGRTWTQEQVVIDLWPDNEPNGLGVLT